MTGLTLSPRTRRRLNNRALDVLTWLVLAVMLAPIFWLVAASTMLMLAMLVWVAVWYRAFRRVLEVT